jgi:hypothetical protein
VVFLSSGNQIIFGSMEGMVAIPICMVASLLGLELLTAILSHHIFLL